MLPHRVVRSPLSVAVVAWGFIQRIFPAFSVNWLSKTKPVSVEEQSKLIATAVLSLPEVAFAETCRQIGFISGCFTEDQRLDTSKLSQSGKLKTIYSDVTSLLI